MKVQLSIFKGKEVVGGVLGGGGVLDGGLEIYLGYSVGL